MTHPTLTALLAAIPAPDRLMREGGPFTLVGTINKDTFATLATLYVLTDIFLNGWMKGILAYGLLISFLLGVGMMAFAFLAIWKERRDIRRQKEPERAHP